MHDLTNPIYELYDAYALLLSEKKREVFEMSYFEDLSLSEISEICNCTRQSISNMLARTCRELNEYESALGMVRRQRELENRLKKIYVLANELIGDGCDFEALKKIKTISGADDE